MSNKKINYCTECKNGSFKSTSKMVCAKDHKIRFYQPRDVFKAMDGDYGWKCKCGEFESKELS